jgi:hypothetical protein
MAPGVDGGVLRASDEADSSYELRWNRAGVAPDAVASRNAAKIPQTLAPFGDQGFLLPLQRRRK